jgi:ATP-binding cassette, subfamily B, bacterial
LNAAKIMERLQQVRYIPATLKLVWQAARWYTVAWLVLILFQGLIPLAIVYLSRPLVNQLVVLIGEGTAEQMRHAILLICLMGGILLLDELVRSVASWVKIAQSELTQDYISNLIQTQSAQLDLAYFESAEYYDRLYRALMEARGRPIALLESLGSLLQNGLTLIGVSAILAMFGLWFPLLLIGSALPAFWIVLRFMVRFNQWRLKNTLDTRRTLYYQVVLTQRETAPELRLLDLMDHFQHAYRRVRERLRRERIGLAKEEAGAHLFAGLFGLLAVGMAMLWILRQALQGLVSLGDIALVYQGLQQGQRILRSLLSNTGELYRNLNFLEDLFGFLALTPQVVDPEEPQPLPDLATADICLEQVTFGYPHGDRRVLDHFSLTLPAGKMVAIVGTNGAGKSTLIKLLCRFYDPDGGRITIGGVDLRHVQIAGLRRAISVLFQQYVSYHASAHENIAFGNWQGAPGRADVQRAAREAGADTVIQRLPEKYNTELGRWFGGAELSTGEWQRISLARAFLRQSPILILDEPTSAMDAWAETEWLHNFRRLARGRTTLLITHRFTTAMYADMIHVMDEGVVVESGSHDELLALGGRYAQSWHDQMRPGAPVEEGEGVLEMA